MVIDIEGSAGDRGTPAVDVAVGAAVVVGFAAGSAPVVADAVVDTAVGGGEEDAAATATRLARRPLPVPISSHRRTSEVWSLLLLLGSSPGFMTSRRTAALYAEYMRIDRPERVLGKV